MKNLLNISLVLGLGLFAVASVQAVVQGTKNGMMCKIEGETWVCNVGAIHCTNASPGKPAKCWKTTADGDIQGMLVKAKRERAPASK